MDTSQLETMMMTAVGVSLPMISLCWFFVRYIWGEFRTRQDEDRKQAQDQNEKVVSALNELRDSFNVRPMDCVKFFATKEDLAATNRRIQIVEDDIKRGLVR